MSAFIQFARLRFGLDHQIRHGHIRRRRLELHVNVERLSIRRLDRFGNLVPGVVQHRNIDGTALPPSPDADSASVTG